MTVSGRAVTTISSSGIPSGICFSLERGGREGGREEGEREGRRERGSEGGREGGREGELKLNAS